MKKIVYANLLFLSFAIHALEFNFKNDIKDTVNISFMVDRNAPYALQKQNAVLNAGQAKAVGVGNTYMGKIFPIRGFVASSAKFGTAQYMIPLDKLDKNLRIKIKPVATGLGFEVN
jgi:hypothetical protein